MNEFTRQSIERMQGVLKQKPKSIHPNGRRNVGNTRKAPSASRIHRVIASIDKHLQRHPNDRVRTAHRAKLDARLAIAA